MRLPPRLPEAVSLRPADLGGTDVVGRASTAGTSTYLLTLDEASLNALLRRWFLSDPLLRAGYPELRVDLRPGGLILHAEVNLGLCRQRLGLLLLKDRQDEMAFTVAGLLVDQQLYAVPEEGFLARAATAAESTLEHTLQALTILGPLPGEAHVSETRFSASQLQILAQATSPVSVAPDTGWQLAEPGVRLRDVDVATRICTERLSIVRLDPARVRFSVRYRPAHPLLVSAWAANLQPLLVVNAGYFTPRDGDTNQTVSLLISDGQPWGAPLGDFAGMFAVTADNQASVRWLREWPYDPGEPLIQAVQSFPVLVKPGGVIGFPADADGRGAGRRTVVAQGCNGAILIIVAPRGCLSLHELALFLAGSDMKVDVALNLDGGASTGLWLKASGVGVEIDSITPVPSVIVAERG